MMQQKKSESPHESMLSDAEELRELISALMRRLQDCEQHHDQDGLPIPSSYAHALMVLHDFGTREQEPTLSDLVELLGIDKSNVTRLCQRMHEASHVLITRDPNDRRAKRITLSELGHALAEHLRQIHLTRYESVLNRFPDQDRHHVLEALTRLNDALEVTG